MNIYPAQLNQIVRYCEALNRADEEIGFNLPDGMTVQLLITVTDENGHSVLGTIADEVGGSWSFTGAA